MKDSNSAFLGSGWGFPPEFSASGANVRMATQADDIRESIGIILSTRIRERAMHSTFGCDLHQFLFDEISAELETSVRETVRKSLVQYEPRIEVEDVQVHIDNDLEGKVLVEIAYIVRATNNRSNMVFPFYLNEATSPQLDI